MTRFGERLKRYLQLGRVQTAMLTVIGILFGAYASGPITPMLILQLFFIGFFAHLYGNALNELADRRLDATVPECATKPLVAGTISVRNAWAFTVTALGLAMGAALLFFWQPTTIAYAGLSLGLITFYDLKGKHLPWLYDFSLPAGVAFSTLFGASAANGVTPLALVFAFISLWAGAFMEWEGAMKDVETDRQSPVPTRAVRWGYRHGRTLMWRDKNFVYAVGLKLTLLVTCALPIAFALTPPIYIVVFVSFGVPTQLYLLFLIRKTHERGCFTRLAVQSETATLILTGALLFPSMGLLGVFVVLVAPVVWFLCTTSWIYRSPMLPTAV